MPADYYTTPQGTYAVRCQLIEKDAAIMDLTMAAPNQEAARAICKSGLRNARIFILPLWES